MDLIRKLFWVVLTAAFTFGFVVLFEHGTVDYAGNAQREFVAFKAMMINKPEKKKENDPLKQ